MSQSWKRLPLPSDVVAPPVLFKYRTTLAGYEINITDLVHLWSETLSHSKILERASTDDTSIDPNEDEGQYLVFLQKIKDALTGSKGGTVNLTRGPGERQLRLITTTKLPHPLEPLKWTFSLLRSPQNAITKQFLLPLLKDEVNNGARLRSLLQQLKEKDRALSKLLDKLESSGVDLSVVFPTMASQRHGRKGSAFAHAVKVIKGVAPFDEESWNADFQAQDPDFNLGVNIAKELSLSSGDLQKLEPVSDGWWHLLGTTDLRTKSSEEFPSRGAEMLGGEDISQSNNEFKTREAPLKLEQSGHDRHQDLVTKDTEQHSTLDGIAHVDPDRNATTKRCISSVSTPTPSPPSKAKARPKNLGTISGKRTLPIERVISLPQAAEDALTDELSTQSDDVEAAPRSERSEREDKHILDRQLLRYGADGTLGKIGGRQNLNEKRIPSSPEDKSSEEEATQLSHRRQNKNLGEPKNGPSQPPRNPRRAGQLGLIGGKPHHRHQLSNTDSGRVSLEPRCRISTSMDSETGNCLDDEQDMAQEKPYLKSSALRSPSPAPTSHPSPLWLKEDVNREEKEETAAEKANRKREKLKHQLKSKTAAPAKRRRRF